MVRVDQLGEEIVQIGTIQLKKNSCMFCDLALKNYKISEMNKNWLILMNVFVMKT